MPLCFLRPVPAPLPSSGVSHRPYHTRGNSCCSAQPAAPAGAAAAPCPGRRLCLGSRRAEAAQGEGRSCRAGAEVCRLLRFPLPGGSRRGAANAARQRWLAAWPRADVGVVPGPAPCDAACWRAVLLRSSVLVRSDNVDEVLCSRLWVTLLGQGVGLGDPQRALPTPAMLGFCHLLPWGSGSDARCASLRPGPVPAFTEAAGHCPCVASAAGARVFPRLGWRLGRWPGGARGCARELGVTGLRLRGRPAPSPSLSACHSPLQDHVSKKALLSLCAGCEFAACSWHLPT